MLEYGSWWQSEISSEKRKKAKITAFWKDTIYKTEQNQVYELIKIPHISIYLGYVW